MSKMELLASDRAFVDAQITVDAERNPDAGSPVVVPYSEFRRRAVSGMLLSGRVKRKIDAALSRTDVNRITWEAGVYPHLGERVGWSIATPIRTTSLNAVRSRDSTQ